MLLGICNDDMITKEHILFICNSVISSHGINCEIKEYSDVCSALDEGPDILILDAKIPDTEKETLEEKLLKCEAWTTPIFIGDESGREGKLRHFAFCDREKSELETKLPELLLAAISRVNRLKKDFCKHFDNVMYIRAGSSAYCHLFFADGRESRVVRKTCTELEEKLRGNGFFRSDKSFLVNMKYVKKISNKVIFENGFEVPISRRKKRVAKQLYGEYCGKEFC